MTRVTYDRWLHGSSLLELKDGRATVRVRDAYAVEWCAHRLITPIRRTLSAVIGADVEITFCTDDPGP
jgi:hypothetical protein